MKKLFGLFIVLSLSIGGGYLYFNSTTFKAQDVPDSYKILDDLENKGIYAGQDFKITDLDGKEILLSSLKGKIVIFSFWATWCEPCVQEFPSFIKLLDEFPDKIILLALSHDYEAKDVREFVTAFKGYRKNMVLSMDEGKKLSDAFGVDRLPEGFVFDGQGKLVKKIIGIQDWATPNAIKYFQSL